MSAVLEQKNETQLVEFDPFRAKLAEYHKRYDNVVYDMDNEDQNKQARSDRLAIGKEIAALDRKHAEIKAPLLERTRILDGARKDIKDDLLDIQSKIKSQIEAHEAKIAEHQAMLQAKVDYFENHLAFLTSMGQPTAAVMRGLLIEIKAIDVDDSYEHRKADATLAQIDAIKKLEAMIGEAEKREAEQAELEALRKAEAERAQKEREAQIAKEAAENARRDAEAAKQREIEAAQLAQRKAEEDARLAEQQAQAQVEAAAKAERERIEREQQEAAAKAEAERQAEEAKKAKVQHRNKIHKEAKASFIAAGLDEQTATQVVTCIKDGLIKHVQVVY